ncbi:spore coat protein A [Nonomuraea polychroma]|uniref:Spore coat protein A n=1 Tax=Nonomuraea polychroma TaxID=46176 RepID=A0A438M5Q8_9ACTN|nr:multicopper oxidase domain-containing protein [Nonomuraea polychroma]RVX41200.1 spore coat protein A [Nonomuraea polychroma]
MSLSRRRLLRTTASGLILAPLAGCGGSTNGGGSTGGANVETESSAGSLLRSTARLPEPFTVPLPIPPVLRPSSAGVYEITQRVGQAEILPGLRTQVWGYNGIFPGPTIVSRRGHKTVVRHRNELPEPVVVHLHGGRTPAEHDGYPTDLVSPGSVHEYVYPLDQPAATLWYHDHRMDHTGPQVYKGLAGFHLVHDDEEEALPLPKGERDVPLMIADRSFAEDGSMIYPDVHSDFISGVLGDCVLVNGAPWPVMEVTAARYRFRLLNASNARRYRLALDPPPPGGASFIQIGSDLGLLGAPVAHPGLQIAQAERFDVVVDFSGYPVGQEVTLTNRLGQDGTANVMRFVVARKAPDDSRVPGKLTDFRPLSPSEAVAERTFTFQRGGAERHGTSLWTVNGRAFSPDHIAATPRLGTVERWTLRAQNVAHPIHIHLTPFQVLDPGPYATGWKDTVDLASGDQVEVLVRFDSYRGKYVFHCHNLEHEDMMMMANFRII